MQFYAKVAGTFVLYEQVDLQREPTELATMSSITIGYAVPLKGPPMLLTHGKEEDVVAWAQVSGHCYRVLPVEIDPNVVNAALIDPVQVVLLL